MPGLLVEQIEAISSWLAELDDADFGRPSVLPNWDIRTLVGHLVLIATGYPQVLSQPSDAPALPGWQIVSRYRPAVDLIEERTRAVTADHGPAELRSALSIAAADIAATATISAPRVLEGPRGPMTAEDWRRTRLLELVLHSDDLSRSMPGRPGVRAAPKALADSVRLVAGMLAERHPGRSVEVRIPPYVAIQCVQGPRHTRGTPPNVVETDGWTLLRLAGGRLSWDEAARTAQIRASGQRADLAAQLPLFS